MLNLTIAGAVCFFNKLRDVPFKLPIVVTETLDAANIPSSDYVYFRRLEIATIAQLKRLSVEEFLLTTCPVLAAHRLHGILAAHFNNKRKRSGQIVERVPETFVQLSKEEEQESTRPTKKSSQTMASTLQINNGFESYNNTWTLRNIKMDQRQFELLCKQFKIKRKSNGKKRYKYQYEWKMSKVNGVSGKPFTALVPMLQDLQSKQSSCVRTLRV